MGHSRPPRAHLLPALIASDGENWTRMVLTENAGAMAHVIRHSKDCPSCQETLARLFPQGPPQVDWDGEPPDVEELLDRLRHYRPQPPP